MGRAETVGGCGAVDLSRIVFAMDTSRRDMERFEPWWGDFELAPGSALVIDFDPAKGGFVLRG